MILRVSRLTMRTFCLWGRMARGLSCSLGRAGYRKAGRRRSTSPTRLVQSCRITARSRRVILNQLRGSTSVVFRRLPPAPPYNLPGSTVGGSGTQTLLGNFGGTNANGVWNLYVRDRSLTPTTVGSVAGGWGIEFLGSTAAGALISGRVMTASGQGIRNAKVVITGNSLL